MPAQDEAVLIWGAGAMGGTIGAFLTRAGFDVTLVDAVAEHVDAMNANGLTITGPVDAFNTPVRAFTPDSVEGTWRRVLLSVKGQDTRAEDVQRLLPALRECDLYWLEPPLPLEDINGHRVLPRCGLLIGVGDLGLTAPFRH